jgi:hypothetical protein
MSSFPDQPVHPISTLRRKPGKEGMYDRHNKSRRLFRGECLSRHPAHNNQPDNNRNPVSNEFNEILIHLQHFFILLRHAMQA